MAEVQQIKVRYVGDRVEWRDHLYNSGGVWSPNQTVMVPLQAGLSLLRHPEFVRDDDAVEVIVAPAQQAEPGDEAVEAAPLVNLEAMSKGELAQFAQRNFGIVLPPATKIADMRNQIRLQMGKRPA